MESTSTHRDDETVDLEDPEGIEDPELEVFRAAFATSPDQGVDEERFSTKDGEGFASSIRAKRPRVEELMTVVEVAASAVVVDATSVNEAEAVPSEGLQLHDQDAWITTFLATFKHVGKNFVICSLFEKINPNGRISVGEPASWR